LSPIEDSNSGIGTVPLLVQGAESGFELLRRHCEDVHSLERLRGSVSEGERERLDRRVAETHETLLDDLAGVLNRLTFTYYVMQWHYLLSFVQLLGAQKGDGGRLGT
jgi:hypothetical protein